MRKCFPALSASVRLEPRARNPAVAPSLSSGRAGSNGQAESRQARGRGTPRACSLHAPRLSGASCAPRPWFARKSPKANSTEKRANLQRGTGGTIRLPCSRKNGDAGVLQSASGPAVPTSGSRPGEVGASSWPVLPRRRRFFILGPPPARPLARTRARSGTEYWAPGGPTPASAAALEESRDPRLMKPRNLIKVIFLCILMSR